MDEATRHKTAVNALKLKKSIPTILSILALITVLFGLIQFSIWPLKADIARLEKDMVEVKRDVTELKAGQKLLMERQNLIMERLDLLLKNQNQSKK